MPDISNDLFSVLPINAMSMNTVLSAKEKAALVRLSEANKDQYGRIIVPSNVDPMAIIKLLENGYIKNAAYPYTSRSTNVVELTKEGKDTITKLLLVSPSKYELLNKTASKKEIKPIIMQNWLQRASYAS